MPEHPSDLETALHESLLASELTEAEVNGLTDAELRAEYERLEVSLAARGGKVAELAHKVAVHAVFKPGELGSGPWQDREAADEFSRFQAVASALRRRCLDL